MFNVRSCYIFVKILSNTHVIIVITSHNRLFVADTWIINFQCQNNITINCLVKYKQSKCLCDYWINYSSYSVSKARVCTQIILLKAGVARFTSWINVKEKCFRVFCQIFYMLHVPRHNSLINLTHTLPIAAINNMVCKQIIHLLINWSMMSFSFARVPAL